jgi:CDP-6-deoxy-D-xylo-4-hexulose-3-dehydrase
MNFSLALMEYKLATSSWGKEEIDAIHRVIASDNYSMGQEVETFQEEFSSFFGVRYSVMCSSGSTANLLMIASLFYRKTNPLKRGDEIIVPAVSWSTTYFPLQQYGLHVKFVDIDLNTLNFDLNQLSEAVSDKTKVILAVNLLGNPNDFDSINNIIGEKDIILLEDNCESMGAKYKGNYAGTFGLMGTFSSFFSHHISTMEGGMITTNDEEIYHILLSLRAHGWTRNLPKENHVSPKSDDWFEESFKFVLPGYNVRPLEMSGAIGIEQLKKLPNFIDTRRKNSIYFKNLFSKDDRFIIQEEIENSSWFGFSFIIKDSSYTRSGILNKLSQYNIETRPIVTGNFTKNNVLKYFDYSVHGNLSNAKYLDTNGFFVGNSQEDLSKEIEYLYKIINQ